VRDPDYKENERPTKTSRFALSDSEDTSGDENVHVNAYHKTQVMISKECLCDEYI
jgi:hypothetical protein